MNNYYQIENSIVSSEVDSNSALRFDSVLKIFQDITTAHSAHMKVDHDNLIASSNAYWVLAKIKFKIAGDIKTGDKYTAKTWPLAPSLLMFIREYKIATPTATVDGRSEWCVLDATTLAIRKSNTIVYPQEMAHIEEKTGVSDFIRLREEVCETDFVYNYQTVFTDIDCNKHVNNLSYARMALNTFTPEEFSEYSFSACEVHFVSQSYFGDIISIYKKKTQSGVYVEGKKQNATVFKVLFYNE